MRRFYQKLFAGEARRQRARDRSARVGPVCEVLEPRLLLSATAFDEMFEPLSATDQSIGVIQPTSLPGVDLTWTPAHSSNYKATNRAASDMRWLIFHTTEATADSVIATSQSFNSGLSYHYLVRRDGSIVQLVADDDAAYHSGNLAYDFYSIGIAMERYGGNSVTEEQEFAAGMLARWLLGTYNMSIRFPDGIAPADPTTRVGIIGHNQVPDPQNPALGGGSMHATDPTNWDFEHFRIYGIELLPRNKNPQIGSITGVLSGSDLTTQTLTLTAHDVTDRDGEVTHVEFYYDRNKNNYVYSGIYDDLIATDTDGSDGWSVTLYVKDIGGSGDANYGAIAYDNDGGVSQPAMTTVNIVRVAAYVIEGNGHAIENMDNRTSVVDGTHFGQVKVNSSITHTFSIRNIGNMPIEISPPTGLLSVTFGGGDSRQDWSVVKKPESRIEAGESTTFQIRFKPLEIGPSGQFVIIQKVNGDTFRFGVTGDGISTDSTRPTVTVNQASTQDDPAQTEPILFDVQFSEPVTGFSALDLNISGTSGANQGIVTGSGSKYQVAVSGMTQEGTVKLSIRENAAKDAAGNWSYAPTSTDNTVWYSPAAPIDNAPNTWRKALNLGRLDLQQPSSLIEDYVGPEDRKDWYRFRITSKSLTKVAVVNYNGNSDLKLFRKSKDGTLVRVATSIKPGDANELIKRRLNVGWYYAVVLAPVNAATDYRFVTRLLDVPAADSVGTAAITPADTQYLFALASMQTHQAKPHNPFDRLRWHDDDEKDNEYGLVASWL